MNKAKKPTDLTKGSSPKTSPELTEKDLSKVSGGLKIGEVAGESTDDKHKGTIELESWS
jgi:bacteriocin-like protein